MSITTQTMTFQGPTESFERFNKALVEVCGADGEPAGIYYRLDDVDRGRELGWPVVIVKRLSHWPPPVPESQKRRERIRSQRKRIGSFGDVEP
jgi:hypothetical protein